MPGVDRFFTILEQALTSGHPPLYVQLGVVTAVFIALHLLLILRGRSGGGVSAMLNIAYFVTMIALSLGLWEFINDFYSQYGRQMVRTVQRLI